MNFVFKLIYFFKAQRVDPFGNLLTAESKHGYPRNGGVFSFACSLLKPRNLYSISKSYTEIHKSLP